MAFTTDIPGWLHKNEVPAIERICSLVPEGANIIECGAFAGRTTQILASCCPSSTIYSLDPWWPSDNPDDLEGMQEYAGPAFNRNQAKEVFYEKIVNVYKNVVPVQGRFPQDVPLVARENIGLIYWDTDSVHDDDRMHAEIDLAWRTVVPGGLIAGHTFAWWMPSVVKVVRYVASGKGADVILPPSGSIWMIKKPHA